MVSGQVYGGGTSFCNTGMEIASSTWHLKTLGKSPSKLMPQGHGVAGLSLMELGYSGNGQRNGTLLI